MKIKKTIYLDFEIDWLTNSIENAISGEVFETLIMKLTEGKEIKKSDWTFNWHNAIKDKKMQVYKLTTLSNPKIIHGLISLTDKGDHIFMDLIESAKFNRGKNKLYRGVAGNLVAFGCKMAFELNYDGVVSFIAKTQLITHYEQTLGAKLFTGNRMFIDSKEALILTTNYFKDFKL
ncbi:MAG: hypothetical protein ABIW38_10045 [Ferruginibacter sp.]